MATLGGRSPSELSVADDVGSDGRGRGNGVGPVAVASAVKVDAATAVLTIYMVCVAGRLWSRVAIRDRRGFDVHVISLAYMKSDLTVAADRDLSSGRLGPLAEAPRTGLLNAYPEAETHASVRGLGRPSNILGSTVGEGATGEGPGQ